MMTSPSTSPQQTEDAEVTATPESQETNQQPEQTVDYDALETKIGSRLAQALGDEAPDDGPEETPDESGETPGEPGRTPDESEEGDSETPGESGEEAETPDESEENEKAEEAAADDSEQSPDAPTLPDPYRRSLKAYGWSDDEIDQNLEALGDKFLDTAQKIHSNRNAELQKWADAGRKAREQSQQQGDPNALQSDPNASPGDQNAQSQTGSQQNGQVPSSLKPVDADALKEKYGEDELIDQIVAPVNATIQAINSILPQLEQGVQQSQQNEQHALVREIESFFGDDSLEPYRDLYGDSNSDEPLAEEQWERRNKVLETADALIAGAELQGRKLSTREALELAHDTVSTEFQKQAVRKGIKKTAKQRNRGITTRPSNRGSEGVTPKGQPQSREDLETRTAQRLKKAFSA